jgi:predicted N-acetyltransferase YhbS
VKGIRLSRPDDLDAMGEIWNASFPGDGAFADWFLTNVYAPERALIWEEGDCPGAMLHLLPIKVRSDGREAPATYVYAVATLPSLRGRGAASALIEEAAALERARGAKALVLVPQSEGLFGYYSRLGFQNALFHAKRVIRAEAAPPGFAVANAPDAAEMNALYETALCGRDCVARSDADWARSLSYLGAVGVLRNGRLAGYAVYDPEGGVRELIAGDDEGRRAVEQAVLHRLGVPEAVASGPEGPVEPYGMARALEPGFTLGDYYAGLMLD